MTRDEAEKKLRDAVPAWGSGAMLVDSLVALGMLKLDEPTSAEDTACDIYSECAGAGNSSLQFLNQIDAAGLKIVEK